jgi:hypothetical protein
MSAAGGGGGGSGAAKPQPNAPLHLQLPPTPAHSTPTPSAAAASADSSLSTPVNVTVTSEYTVAFGTTPTTAQAAASAAASASASPASSVAAAAGAGSPLAIRMSPSAVVRLSSALSELDPGYARHTRAPPLAFVEIPAPRVISREQFFAEVWPSIEVRDARTGSFVGAQTGGLLFRDAFSDRQKGAPGTAHAQAEFLMPLLRFECERSEAYRDLLTRIHHKYGPAARARAQAQAQARAQQQPSSSAIAVSTEATNITPVTLWLGKNSAAFVDHESEWTFDADDLKTFPIDPNTAHQTLTAAASTEAKPEHPHAASAAAQASAGSQTVQTGPSCCHMTRGELLMHVLEERYYMG